MLEFSPVLARCLASEFLHGRPSPSWSDKMSPVKTNRPGRIRAALERIKRIFRRSRQPEPPTPDLDPYAYVTAPKKPRPSNRSGAAVMELPEE
jgi:hypothetical protein